MTEDSSESVIDDISQLISSPSSYLDTLAAAAAAARQQTSSAERETSQPPQSGSNSSVEDEDTSMHTVHTEPESSNNTDDTMDEVLFKLYGHPKFKSLSMDERSKAYAVKDLSGLQALYAYLETNDSPGGEEFANLVDGISGGTSTGKTSIETDIRSQTLRRVMGMGLESPLLPSHSAKFVRQIIKLLKADQIKIWPNIVQAQEAVGIVLRDSIERIPDVRPVRVQSAERFLIECERGSFEHYNWQDFIQTAARLSGLPNTNYHPWEAVRFHGAWKGFKELPNLVKNLIDEILPGKTLEDVDKDPLFQNILRLSIPDIVWMECMKIQPSISSVSEFLKVAETLKTDTRFTSNVLRLSYGIPQKHICDYSGIGIRPIHPILDSYESEGPIINHMRLLLPDFYPQGIPTKLDQHLPPLCNETRQERNAYRMNATNTPINNGSSIKRPRPNNHPSRRHLKKKKI